jgi:Fe-Mn family superoxide dismutase
MLTMTRREMLHVAGAGAAALVLAPSGLLTAQDKVEGFTLPKLPYAYDALEPSIDKETMTIHHDKHHQAYINNLNKALAKHPDLLKKPIEELVADYKKAPEDVRTAIINNGGGHANHTLFWEIMGPKGGGKPSGSLAKAIDDTFGTLEKFQAEMKAKALGQFGSGWAWLVVEKGKLKAINLPNQISPLMEGQTPLMGIDVWEHAYYLKYRNLRDAYVDAWWKVVNWPEVQKRYEKAVKS